MKFSVETQALVALTATLPFLPLLALASETTVGSSDPTPAETATDASAPPVVSHAGEWLRHRGSLTEEVTAAGASNSLFNPSQRVFPVDSVSNLLHLNLEMIANLPAKSSIKTQLASELLNGSSTTQTFSVRELYGNLSLGDLDLSVGRKILKWTNGYAFNPAGLLEPKRDPSDPQDRLKRLQGLDMAQLDYYFGDDTFTAAFTSDRPATKSTGIAKRGLGLRANFIFRELNLDFAAMGLITNAKNTGALSFSYVLGDNLGFHGEVAGTVGTDTLYPSAIVPGNQQMLFTTDFFAPLKRDSRRLFLRYLAGVNYTFANGVNVIGEYYHSDEGASSDEWQLFLDQARFSRAQLETDLYPVVANGHSLPELNLLQGLQWLGTQGLRQNYLFVRGARTWFSERLTAEAFTLIDLDDRSFLITSEWTFLLRVGLTVYLRGTFAFGSGSSEFGNIPTARSANLGLRFYF